MEKTGIKALIFDYGGVISKPQNLNAFQEILRMLGVDENHFREIYYTHRKNYDNGQLSGREYWRLILQYFGLEAGESLVKNLIQADVKSWTQIDASMMRFITATRAKVEKLAIISNMIRDTLAYMRSHFEWLEMFDGQIYSCEIGINKPDGRIFEFCLNSLEVSAQDCLFVDDSEKNVCGAKNAGMNGIHYKSFPHFLQEFSEKYYLIGESSS